jgi:hypothetical protein
MRRRMLQALDSGFRNYLLFFGVMWLGGPLVTLVTLLLLRTPAPFWLLLVISTFCWTLICAVDIVLARVLKALFHGRVLHALANQKNLKSITSR